MKIKLITAVVLSITFVLNASNIIYVDADSPNEPGSGTFNDPFRRIQDAIDNGSNGDEIEIRPGVYTGAGNYNINPNGKSVTIRSINPEDANITAGTIIDPDKQGRAFNVWNQEDTNCVISGLTVTNGLAAGNSGGGILCSGSNPTIRYCIITQNSADLYGGGIYCFNANPRIEHCIIRNNLAVYDGGGIECDSSSNPELTNCLITNNQAAGFGGGADFYDLCNPVLTNCTIAKNSADFGGGLCSTDSNIVIQNSILWQNHAEAGSQIALQSFVTVSYSNVQGGQAGVYDPCESLVWGSNNIDTDPCFVSFDPDADPNLWDFHLQSIYGRWDANSKIWVTDSNTSLCIDAADPDSDWSGEQWPNGRRANMGFYGRTSQASKNGNPADFNIDNSVDFIDFADFAGYWMAGGDCIEDLTGNGTVNLADAAVFAANWLWER